MNTDEMQKLVADMQQVVHHLRFSIDQARSRGEPQGAIVASQGDKGVIVCRFDIETFLADLELLLNVPPTTIEELTEIQATAFKQMHGLHSHECGPECNHGQ